MVWLCVQLCFGNMDKRWETFPTQLITLYSDFLQSSKAYHIWISLILELRPTINPQMSCHWYSWHGSQRERQFCNRACCASEVNSLGLASGQGNWSNTLSWYFKILPTVVFIACPHEMLRRWFILYSSICPTPKTRRPLWPMTSRLYVTVVEWSNCSSTDLCWVLHLCCVCVHQLQPCFNLLGLLKLGNWDEWGDQGRPESRGWSWKQSGRSDVQGYTKGITARKVTWADTKNGFTHAEALTDVIAEHEDVVDWGPVGKMRIHVPGSCLEIAWTLPELIHLGPTTM